MSGPTTDMLRALLSEKTYDALGLLADSPASLSGRTVATQIGVAPSTATAALAKLREAGLTESSLVGRSELWSVNEDNAVIRSWLSERHSPSGLTVLVKQKTEALLKVWRSARASAAHERKMLKEHWPGLYQALNGLDTTEHVARSQEGSWPSR